MTVLHARLAAAVGVVVWLCADEHVPGCQHLAYQSSRASSKPFVTGRMVGSSSAVTFSTLASESW